jgi:hypothetical protein
MQYVVQSFSDARDVMRGQVCCELVAFADVDDAMLLTMGKTKGVIQIFKGCLTRFKLICLKIRRRISLATLPRYDRRVENLYILPASGWWSHSLPR